eukprot:1181401-Prorocentrum_minimum.AAC.1
MMALPNRDYDLYLHMIPERIQAEEPFVSLNNLASLLVGAKFRDFWLSYANMKDSLDAGRLSFAERTIPHKPHASIFSNQTLTYACAHIAPSRAAIVVAAAQCPGSRTSAGRTSCTCCAARTRSCPRPCWARRCTSTAPRSTTTSKRRSKPPAGRLTPT